MLKFNVTLKTASGKDVSLMFTAAIEKYDNGFIDELRDIGILFLREFDLNFLAGGRPDRWDQSLAAILRGGMTLVDKGLLRASVTIEGFLGGIFEVYDLSLVIGSSLPYAKVMHDGNTDGSPNPPRPYLVISPDTLQIAGEIILEEILGTI